MFLLLKLFELSKNEYRFFFILILLLPSLIFYLDSIIRYAINTSPDKDPGETGLFYGIVGDKLFSGSGTTFILVVAILIWCILNIAFLGVFSFLVPMIITLLAGSELISISIMVLIGLFIIILAY